MRQLNTQQGCRPGRGMVPSMDPQVTPMEGQFHHLPSPPSLSPRCWVRKRDGLRQRTGKDDAVTLGHTDMAPATGVIPSSLACSLLLPAPAGETLTRCIFPGSVQLVSAMMPWLQTDIVAVVYNQGATCAR